MTQITKTQVFSQIVDQKEQKNNWYRFGGSTSRFQHLPNVHCTFINQSFGKLVSGTAAMSATTSSLEGGGEGWGEGGWGAKSPVHIIKLLADERFY